MIDFIFGITMLVFIGILSSTIIVWLVSLAGVGKQ